MLSGWPKTAAKGHRKQQRCDEEAAVQQSKDSQLELAPVFKKQKLGGPDYAEQVAFMKHVITLPKMLDSLIEDMCGSPESILDTLYGSRRSDPHGTVLKAALKMECFRAHCGLSHEYGAYFLNYTRLASWEGWWDGVFPVIRAFATPHLFPVNRYDIDDHTYLSHAVMQDNVEAVRELLELCPFTNVEQHVNSKNITPRNISGLAYHSAAKHRDTSVKKELDEITRPDADIDPRGWFPVKDPERLDRIKRTGVRIIDLAETLGRGREGEIYKLLDAHVSVPQMSWKQRDEFMDDSDSSDDGDSDSSESDSSDEE